MIKQKITFTDDVEVLDHEDKVEQSFKKGETVDLPAPSAQRWIRREKAKLAAKRGRPAKTTDESGTAEDQSK